VSVVEIVIALNTNAPAIRPSLVSCFDPQWNNFRNPDVSLQGEVTSPSFEIALSDRVAGKSSAAATFSFTTTAGGALAIGSTITLTYPSGFFSGTGSPAATINGVSGGAVATPTSTQIVVTAQRSGCCQQWCDRHCHGPDHGSRSGGKLEPASPSRRAVDELRRLV